MSGDTQNNDLVKKDYLKNVANSLSGILDQLTDLLTEVKSNISTKEALRKPRQFPDKQSPGTRSFFDRYGIDAGPKYCQPKQNANQARRSSAPKAFKPFRKDEPLVLLPPPPTGQCEESETNLVEQPPPPPMISENTNAARRKWNTDASGSRRQSRAVPAWLTKMNTIPSSPSNQPSAPVNVSQLQSSPKCQPTNFIGSPPLPTQARQECVPDRAGMYFVPLDAECRPRLQRQNAQERSSLSRPPLTCRGQTEVKKDPRLLQKRELAKKCAASIKSMNEQSGPQICAQQFVAENQPAKPVGPQSQSVVPPARPAQMPKLRDVGVASRRFYDQHGIDPLNGCNFPQNASRMRRYSAPSDWGLPAIVRPQRGAFTKPRVGSTERRFYAQHGIDVPPEYNTPAVSSQSRRRSAPGPSVCPTSSKPADPCMGPCPNLSATYQKPSHRRWSRPQAQNRPSNVPSWLTNTSQPTCALSPKQRKKKPSAANVAPKPAASAASRRSSRTSQVPNTGPTHCAARAKRNKRKSERQTAGADVPSASQSIVNTNPSSGGHETTPETTPRLPLDSLETLRHHLGNKEEPSTPRGTPKSRVQVQERPNFSKPTKLSEQIGKSIAGRLAKRLIPLKPEKTVSTAKYNEAENRKNIKNRRITFSEPVTRQSRAPTPEPTAEKDYGYPVDTKAQYLPTQAEKDSPRTSFRSKAKPKQDGTRRVAEIEAQEPTKEISRNAGVRQRSQDSAMKLAESLGSLGWDLLNNTYTSALAL